MIKIWYMSSKNCSSGIVSWWCIPVIITQKISITTGLTQVPSHVYWNACSWMDPREKSVVLIYLVLRAWVFQALHLLTQKKVRSVCAHVPIICCKHTHTGVLILIHEIQVCTAVPQFVDVTCESGRQPLLKTQYSQYMSQLAVNMLRDPTQKD